MDISKFFFAKQNDDGTCGEPIKGKIVDLDFATQGVGDPIPMPDFMGMEVSGQLDYKQTKDFVWNVILNLKRSAKHLVSKNIYERRVI